MGMPGGFFKRKSKELPVKDTVQKTGRLTTGDTVGHLYAIMRRLGERITDLERREGENRRDISRIEKRHYRTVNDVPQVEEKTEELPAGLFQ